MSVMHPNMGSDEGYTLLELLAAMAIMALLAVPIAGSIRLGLFSWQTSHATVEKQERAFLVHARINEWLKRAYALDNRRTSGHYVYPLVGSTEAVEFSAPIHPDPNQDALYRVRLRLEEGVLQAGTAPDFSYLADDTEWQWSDLITGVDGVTFSFLAGVDAAGSAIWTGEWGNSSETVDLPVAVKMELDLLDPTLSWETSVVAMSIEEQAFCRFLPNERKCLSGANAG